MVAAAEVADVVKGVSVVVVAELIPMNLLVVV